LLALLVLEVLFFSFNAQGFADNLPDFLGLTENFVPTGLVAIGVTIVILGGGIDLSVASLASLCAVVMAALWQGGMNIWLATLIALALSIVLGAFNGVLVVAVRIEPLIATLATGFIFTSLATAIAGESPPYGFPDQFNALGHGTTVAGIPFQLLIFIGLAIVFYFVMSRTGFGRSTVMIGYNRPAAWYSGIRVKRTLLVTYVISGGLSGLAGILLSAFYSAVRPDIGSDLLLPAITMAVLGGIDIFGGEGNIVGAIISVFLLGFLTQGMLIMGFSSLVATMVTGAILLLTLLGREILRGKLYRFRSAIVRFIRSDGSSKIRRER
jgi:ribose/xylose/arabinose/galactoside ABC-type transport system permease subunit